ncbi:SDR family oxidoreductase [Curtobacterium ammoniigenes]|uniref:SDR family oxidoreductase n=1 Tax=Curtobacterium ammoniigenes TaxID=395387 RepID=UPI001C3F33BF|nr:SDR family oxidoreductase [Curtobacterium ammoniigenes]
MPTPDRGAPADPFAPDLMAGERVLITGGGSGLGRAIAATVIEHGGTAVLWGRRGGVLDATAAALASARPGSVAVQTVDVRDADAVDTAVDELWQQGPLTGVVNGAAANFIAPTESLSARAFAAVTSTVISGSFHVTHSVGRRWIADGRGGSVLSLLTTWVETGSAYVVPSAMSKAAVNAMTMSLAVEWAHYGIRLNAIAPGPVPTDFAWDVLDPGSADVIGATDVRGVPAGRYGRPDEVANLALFLLSRACDYLTGETIAMDGGQRLAGPATFSDLTRLTPDDWAAIRSRAKAAAAASKADRS